MNNIWYKIKLKWVSTSLTIAKKIFNLKMKLSLNERPHSYPYITSDGFRYLADHVYDKIDRHSEIAKVNNDDIIFVNSDYIDEYFKYIHSHIKNKYILITHSGIKPIDKNTIKYLDEKIIHWFGKNVLIENDKVTPLPIGLENLWKHGTGIKGLYNKKYNGNKKNKILYHFKVATNPEERQKALEYISSHPMAETYSNKLPPPLYLKKLRKYKFVISPPGAGEECHRTWEAIYSGVIPIVKSSVATEYFFKLGAPIWVVKDWEELDEVDEEILNNKYIEITKQSNKEVIYMDYWINKLEKYASNNLLKNRLLKNKNLPLIYIKNIYKKIRNIGWHIFYKYRRQLVDLIKRRSKKIKRLIIKEEYKQAYTFAITCVKRDSYVDLIIKNINSLHYINPTHYFVIYVDNKCEKALKNKINSFDYPGQIKIKNKYTIGNKSWQEYKIETFIDASSKNYIMTDADEIWHAEPTIDEDKITFLVSPKTILEREYEKLIIKNTFKNTEWLKFRYYSTGFLAMPKKFMNKEIANNCRKYCKILLNEKFNYIKNKKNREEMKRLSEQMAINLTVQDLCPINIITTLKQIDGPKNTHILQSTYHGTANRILD